MPAKVTDRALRYRAQKNVRGQKRCVICGARSGGRDGKLDVMHLDGNESHGDAKNLAYGCRSCNAALAVAFKSIGAGRPTNQYNPAKGKIPTYGQYAWAVSQQRHSGEHGEPGAIIHATPKHKRVEYAKRILEEKRRRGTDSSLPDWARNPASYRGKSVAELERIRPHVAVLTVDNDWMVRDTGRRELEKVDHALALARKREAKRGNAGPRVRTVYTVSFKVGRNWRRSELGEFVSAESALAAAKQDGREWRIDRVKPKSSNPGRGARAGRNPSDKPVYVAPSTRRKGHWTAGIPGFPIQAKKSKRGALSLAQSWVKSGAAKEVIVRENPGSQYEVWYKAANRWQKAGTYVERKWAEFYAAKDADGRKWKVKRVPVKSNPAAGAAEVFAEFQGRPSTEVIKVSQKVHRHKWLAAAGALVALKVKAINGTLRNLGGLGDALLTFNEAKNQLFITGGDQFLSPAELKLFGVREEHELQTLGKLLAVGYFTDKHHLGDEGGEAIYDHTFRTTNENGRHVIVKIARNPDLIYRVLDQQLEISGGSYKIRAEGIDK